MDVKLNFINESNDKNNSEILFFQKNLANDVDDMAIAWKVIKNCAIGWRHLFQFPLEIKISATDLWGNETIKSITAEYGQLFKVYNDASGLQLAYAGEGTSKTEVQLRNDLAKGSIKANIYKGGKLLAIKTGVSPEQKALFSFNSTLWVGVVSQIQEGEVINSAIISNINTELDLFGVASADIVMRGGGVGSEATKFQFKLENVVYV